MLLRVLVWWKGMGVTPMLRKSIAFAAENHYPTRSMTQEVTAPPAAPQTLAQKYDYSIWQVISASAAGTVIEWYDFYIVGSLAAIISPLFYPPGNDVLALIAYLSTFAVGFVVRPIGAWLNRGRLHHRRRIGLARGQSHREQERDHARVERSAGRRAASLPSTIVTNLTLEFSTSSKPNWFARFCASARWPGG